MFWSLPTFFHAVDTGAFTGLKATTRAVDPQAAMMAADITARSSSSSAETAAADACRLEHVISAETFQRLQEFMDGRENRKKSNHE